MKTILKIMVGVFIGGAALIIAMLVLLGAGASEVSKELDKKQAAHAITPAKFQGVKIGWSEARVKRYLVVAPEDEQAFENKGITNETPSQSSCLYWNRKGGEFGDRYQFCFEGARLRSKNAY